MPPLVTGRVCGECTVCCKVLPADSLDFKKQSGTSCRHCAEGEGCKIYQARPGACRDFFCGWRYLRLLDESWRPDRNGVLILFETDDSCIPSGYYLRPAIKFLITGDKRSIEELKFIAYINGIVHAGVPAFLSVPGPPGHFPVKAFLNDMLKDAVERSDGPAITEKLLKTYQDLKRGSFEAITLPFASASPAPGNIRPSAVQPPAAPLPVAKPQPAPPKAAAPASVIPQTMTFPKVVASTVILPKAAPPPSPPPAPKSAPRPAEPPAFARIVSPAPQPAPAPAAPPQAPPVVEAANAPVAPKRRGSPVNYRVERSNGCLDSSAVRRPGSLPNDMAASLTGVPYSS